MKKFTAVVLSIVLLLSLFCACSTDSKVPEQTGTEAAAAAPGEKKVSVVCSIFPQYDFCREIAGDKIELELLLKSKVDLHNYKPGADDILKIKNCDLFIDIGGESDEWADDVLETLGSEKPEVLSLIDTVEAKEEKEIEGAEKEEHEHEEGEDDEDDEEELDEHVWTSLNNAQSIVSAIADKLCEIDKANAAVYTANASEYLKKLFSLEAQYAEELGKAKRKTLVFADRFPFRYLADDYSLECFAAFAGCSAETQASFETIAFLAGKVKEKELPFVLVIDGSDGSVAETVASQSGAEIKTLNSCQSVSQEEIENGRTYLSIMEENLFVLKEVLN